MSQIWSLRPIVEDELESLSHELGGLSLLGEKPGVEGVCQRGTVDQFPILLDLDYVPRSATADTDSQPPSLVSDSSRESSGLRTPSPVQFFPATKQTSGHQLVDQPSYMYSSKQYAHSEHPARGVADQLIAPFPEPSGFVSQVDMSSSRYIPRVHSYHNNGTGSPRMGTDFVNVQNTLTARYVEAGASHSRLSIADRLEEKARQRKEQKILSQYDDRQSGDSVQRQIATISSAPPSPSRDLKSNVQYISQPSSPVSSQRRQSPNMFQNMGGSNSTTYTPMPYGQEISPVQKRTPSPRNSADNKVTYEAPRPQRAVTFVESPNYQIAEAAEVSKTHRHSSVPPSRSSMSRSPTKRIVTRTSEPATSLALRPCPRSYPAAGYQDWYTISGLEHLNICPSCMGQIGNSRFRDYFIPSINDLRTRVHCSFSDVWTRLAWIQTIKKGHDNLELLYEITRPTGLHCPGRRLSMQSWNRLVDCQTGLNVPKFAACSACTRNIQLLMPPLKQTFRRQPGFQEKICDLAVDSPRFVQYVDLLDNAANQCEEEKREYPDNTRFINYFIRKCNLRDCRRQRLVLGTWHYIPGLPEFTVCEDCYDDVVRPLAVAQKQIARWFATPPRLLPGSGANKCREASCQLYSPRMRAKFRDAVMANNYRMLEFVALKRFDAEQRYREREDALLHIPEKDRGYQWEGEWRRNLENWKAYE